MKRTLPIYALFILAASLPLCQSRAADGNDKEKQLKQIFGIQSDISEANPDIIFDAFRKSVYQPVLEKSLHSPRHINEWQSSISKHTEALIVYFESYLGTGVYETIKNEKENASRYLHICKLLLNGKPISNKEKLNILVWRGSNIKSWEKLKDKRSLLQREALLTHIYLSLLTFSQHYSLQDQQNNMVTCTELRSTLSHIWSLNERLQKLQKKFGTLEQLGKWKLLQNALVARQLAGAILFKQLLLFPRTPKCGEVINTFRKKEPVFFPKNSNLIFRFRRIAGWRVALGGYRSTVNINKLFSLAEKAENISNSENAYAELVGLATAEKSNRVEVTWALQHIRKYHRKKALNNIGQWKKRAEDFKDKAIGLFIRKLIWQLENPDEEFDYNYIEKYLPELKNEAQK